jgi:hypothetical protein
MLWILSGAQKSGVFGNPVSLAVIERFFLVRVVLKLDGLEPITDFGTAGEQANKGG